MLIIIIIVIIIIIIISSHKFCWNSWRLACVLTLLPALCGTVLLIFSHVILPCLFSPYHGIIFLNGYARHSIPISLIFLSMHSQTVHKHRAIIDTIFTFFLRISEMCNFFFAFLIQYSCVKMVVHHQPYSFCDAPCPPSLHFVCYDLAVNALRLGHR